MPRVGFYFAIWIKHSERFLSIEIYCEESVLLIIKSNCGQREVTIDFLFINRGASVALTNFLAFMLISDTGKNRS